MPSPTRVLITFCVGIAATLAWQSYGDAARQIVASSYPQLAWLAPQASQIAHSTPDMIALAAPSAPSPDHQQLNAMSLDLNAVRQNVDRITITQEQITRSVEELTTGQEQMTREITKLQAVEQRILHKTPEPPPRPVPTSRKSVPRSLQAPTGLTPARKSLNQFGARAV